MINYENMTHSGGWLLINAPRTLRPYHATHFEPVNQETLTSSVIRFRILPHYCAQKQKRNTAV